MTNKKIEFLDFAKGYAIFTIVLFHILQQAGLSALLQKMIFFGGTGVHLFFLLSGYGMGLSGSQTDALTFYKRRASKIWLPYVLILTVSLVASLALDIFPDRWQAWLAGIGLYQMFIEPYIASFGGHFWFISAIMQFYLVYPLIRRLVDRFAHQLGLVVLAALSISMIWWLIVFSVGKGSLRIWNSFFLQFLWEFVLGLVLATALRKGQNLKVGPIEFNPRFWETSLLKAVLVGSIFSGIMLIMALKLGAFGKICNDVPALLGYTGICVAAYRLGETYLPFIKQFFLWISGFSFSLYLVHMLGFRLYLLGLESFGLTTNLWILLVYIPIALLLGRLFEPINVAWTSRVGSLLFGAETRKATV
jgi:peptidoglycan/LPS O-acetylase OafA/YrhL